MLENPDGYTDGLLDIYPDLIADLKTMKGGGVDHVPLYSNFPDEVQEPGEYLTKRLLGYVVNVSNWDVPGTKLASGVVVPDWLFNLKLFGADPITQRQDLVLFLRQKFGQLTRRSESPKKPILLRFLPRDEAERVVVEWATDCLTSKSSVPTAYREELTSVLGLYAEKFAVEPKQLVHREHRALYSSFLWAQESWDELARFCDGPTDILRFLVHLCEGDVSLAQPVQFPSLSKNQRRRVLWLLEKMGRGARVEDELFRYRGLWLALERYLHSGSFKRLFPEAHRLLRQLQNNELKPRFSELEIAFLSAEKETFLSALDKLPGGVSVRRFCQAISLVGEDALPRLLPRVEKAALKDQLMLSKVLARDATAVDSIVVTKRGNTKVIDRDPSRIPESVRLQSMLLLEQVIGRSLESRFVSDSWSEKQIYVAPELKHWTVPFALRSASESLTVMGRGTRVPLSDSPTLRLFVYWKQRATTTDLDLSVLTFDSEMRCTGQVSWTNLKSAGLVHSGDLQSAPQGAAEFVDGTIGTVLGKGHRYLAMVVYRYRGDAFSQMDCFCGWMTRDKPDASYKTFDIATVEQKLSLDGVSKYAVPVLFDLQTREAIWLDLRVHGNVLRSSVETSWQDIESLVRLGRRMPDWRLTLHELAELHIQARGGRRTSDPTVADVRFSLDSQGDYHPGNWTKVLSELL